MAGEGFRTTTFAELIRDGLLEIGDGYRAKNEELGGDGPIFLRAGHVTDSHIDFEGVERFQASLADRLALKMSQPGDTIMTTKGNSTGRTSFVTPDLPAFVYSPHLSYWRSRNVTKLAGGFLRYWSRSAEFERQLAGMKASTDMAPYLSLTDQRRLKITLPPPGDQQAIACILGSLDDKIELNRRMNRTLEGMARAIFRSWFVDFDPVRAKAAGKPPPGLKPALANLFPDRFEDSELGEIPKGWKVESIYKAANVIYGAPFSSKRFNTEGKGKPLVRIRDLADESPGVWTEEEHAKGYVIRPGDVVVGMDGEFRPHLWGGAEAWLNQRVCVFQPSPGFSAAFVRDAIAGPLMDVESTETATTVIHLGKADIDRFRAVVPHPAILKAFNSAAQPLYDRIVIAKHESRTLAALRDALLPKLISGELRVPDAERIAARAV